MNTKFYTVDDISNMLNLHPKTVRKFIREGKLKASKVGKQYRVTGHDLSLFTEDKGIIPTQTNPKVLYDAETSNILLEKSTKKISVSTVIDIIVDSNDERDRITNTLLAVMNTKDNDYGSSTMKIQFIEKSNKLRIMLWGTAHFIETLLSCISVLSDE